MNLYNGRPLKSKYRINLNNFLIGCFACWPCFYSLWIYLRFTANISMALSMVFLCVIALLSVFSHKFTKSYLFYWFLFVLMILFGFSKAAGGTIWDIVVYLSGLLLCWSMGKSDWNYEVLLKWTYRMGLLVAITVIVDNITGLFTVSLINIFTDSVILIKTGLSVRVGLMSSSGIASYFIIIGLITYFAMTKTGLKNNPTSNYLVFLIFAVSFVMLRKRGLLLAFLLSILFIRTLTAFDSGTLRFNIFSILNNIFKFSIIAFFCIFIYSQIPVVQMAVDSFADKVNRDDNVFSGRLVLYDLAFNLFLNSPLTGIGWGQFREYSMHVFSLYNQNTYDTHNVYLQLLCETGIIGVSLFVVAIAVALKVAIRTYRHCLKEKCLNQCLYLSKAGLFIQLLFLFYCMSGNPLYDRAIVIMYFFGILLTNLARYKLIKEERKYAQRWQQNPKLIT